MDEDEAEEKTEKKEKKFLKRKLLAPNAGWLDKKCIVLHSYRDSHDLLQHVSDMFWKLRSMLREQVEAAPTD